MKFFNICVKIFNIERVLRSVNFLIELVKVFFFEIRDNLFIGLVMVFFRLVFIFIRVELM